MTATVKYALWIGQVLLALAFLADGAAQLILPVEALTSLAAVGLAIITAGATVTTLVMCGGASALMPLVLGLLTVFVAFRRTQPSRWSSWSANASSRLIG